MKEFYLYLTRLTFSRLANLLLCRVGVAISYITRLPVNIGFPYSISVEPTTRCNLHCTDCITGTKKLERRQGDLSIEMYKKIIDQVKSKAFVVATHFQGEPLLNAQVFEMVKYASSKRMVTEMATNASLINENVADALVLCGLKKIVVTIDSIYFKNFGFYRQGSCYNDVISGIEHLNKAKKKFKRRYPLVVIELLALKQNIDQIQGFKRFVQALNVDRARVKTAEIIDPVNNQEKIPFGTKYSRYKKNTDGSIGLHGNPSAFCSAPWTKLSVTHDGWVVPCCFDKNAFYIMGSVNHWTIKEIWKSNHYNLLRKRLLSSRSKMPVCGTCPQNRVRFDFNL